MYVLSERRNIEMKTKLRS